VTGVRAVNEVDVYARRLGVLPQAYAFTLGYALEQLTGKRQSLKDIGQLLDEVRLREWDRSKAAFRAARAAREWSYFADPMGAVEMAENDREALRRFEMSRNGQRTRRKRRKTQSTSEIRTVPARRSTRKRKRPQNSDFVWNFHDTYVLDLDEMIAPTTKTMNTVSLTVARRRLGRLV